MLVWVPSQCVQSSRTGTALGSLWTLQCMIITATLLHFPISSHATSSHPTSSHLHFFEHLPPRLRSWSKHTESSHRVSSTSYMEEVKVADQTLHEGNYPSWGWQWLGGNWDKGWWLWRPWWWPFFNFGPHSDRGEMRLAEPQPRAHRCIPCNDNIPISTISIERMIYEDNVMHRCLLTFHEYGGLVQSCRNG